MKSKLILIAGLITLPIVCSSASAQFCDDDVEIAGLQVSVILQSS